MRRVVSILLPALAIACDAGPGPAPSPPAAAGWFVELTEEVGLGFTHQAGAAGELRLREIMGAGLAFVDLDGDGRLDVYLTNGRLEGTRGDESDRWANRFYRQRDDGTLVDATAQSGLGDHGYGMGVAVGDLDNDGDRDLYLANDGPDRLFLNRGDGTFEEIGGVGGVAADVFSSSAVSCDYDLDGNLDVYVARYVRHDPQRSCRDSTGRPDYCNPTTYTPEPDLLLHNEGGGVFRDVSSTTGIAAVAAAGLGVVCEDLDDDGLPDFYVANDQYANQLWINRGDGTFEDRAMLRGAAYNLEGRAEAGMGVVAADLDGDGKLDLYLTHLDAESNTFYRNLGSGSFDDVTAVSGLAQPSLRFTGFGAVAFDAELDGDLDLAVANGRVLRASDGGRGPLPQPWRAYAESNQFFLNHDGRYASSPEPGRAFTEPLDVSRALAAGDWDGDGDLDLLVTNVQSGARLYRNDAPRAGGWLTVRAIDPRLQRDAIGARVTVDAGGTRQVRTISSGFSYLTASEPVAHFGLGAASNVDRIEVRWPDGLVEWFTDVGIDRVLTVRRGEGDES